MDESLYSMLLGTSGVTIMAAAALFLAIARKPSDSDPSGKSRLLIFASVATLVQTFHFAEEFFAGLNTLLPQLLGLSPWSATFFASYNIFWLAAFVISVPAIRAGFRAAYFPIWLLGIACVVNAVIHPLISLLVLGYFPGLLTSPLSGVAGVFLVRNLIAHTSGKADSATRT